MAKRPAPIVRRLPDDKPLGADTEFVFIDGYPFVNAAKHDEVVSMHVAEAERLKRLLWDCHCAASDGIPVPFERWLIDDGPDGMPADVKELREAYDTVSEREHVSELQIGRLRKALRFYSDGFAYLTPEGWKRIWRDGGQTARTALETDEIQDGGGTGV